jgi:hypothetical protein
MQTANYDEEDEEVGPQEPRKDSGKVSQWTSFLIIEPSD